MTLLLAGGRTPPGLRASSSRRLQAFLLILRTVTENVGLARTQKTVLWTQSDGCAITLAQASHPGHLVWTGSAVQAGQMGKVRSC